MDRYRILRPIGKGAMGEVFLAEDTLLERRVALKFLTPELELEPLAGKRFEREAKSAAALDHPFICKIYELGKAEGKTFIAMEYAPGETLQERLKRGPLRLKEALRYATEISEALEEAHRHQIVHRDLKPANIMLTEQGHVKVMDFGLAKHMAEPTGVQSEAETLQGEHTRPGLQPGTPLYMSPEQLMGREAEARSDMFSFGIVLHEMLTGIHPFKRTRLVETMGAILRDLPAPAGRHLEWLPAGLNDLVEKLLSKNPSDRFVSFQEVRVNLASLMEQVPSLATAPPVVKRTSFVGREAEQAELRILLDQVEHGRGGLVLISGEPGVGKTRLAQEMLAEARRRGMLSLTGRCYETEGAPPFIPFVEVLEEISRSLPLAELRKALGEGAPEVARLMPALRHLLPDIAKPLRLPPEQQRRYLFQCFHEFLERACRSRALALLLDDLHWADDSTVLLLQHLAQRLKALPVFILGTYRDVELDVSRPFARVLENLVRQRLALRLAIKKLARQGVADMLENLGGKAPPSELVEAIFDETEGNPFFVEEVFQHLSEEGKLFDAKGEWKSDLRVDELDVPEGVRLAIGRRLDRLDEKTRHMLTAASLMGRSFDLNLLLALTDLDADVALDALEEGERGHLITSRSEGREIRYGFNHELIRQTLVSGLSLPRRQRMHLRVAEAMEKVYEKNLEAYASDLAYHLYQAGAAVKPEKAVLYLILAGERAMGVAGFEEALRHYENALSLRETRGDKEHADLLAQCGLALGSIGRVEEALDHWNQAIDIYEKLGNHEAVARNCLRAAFLLAWLLRLDQSLKTARRGIQAAGVGPSSVRCLLLAAAGLAQGMSGEFQAAEKLFEESVAAAEKLEEPRSLGVVLSHRAVHYLVYSKLEDELAALSQSVELLRSAGDLWELSGALGFMALDSILLGRPDDARKLLKELEPHARLGNPGAVTLAARSRVYLAVMESGSLEAIEEAVRNDLEAERRANVPFIAYSYIYLGFLDVWRGRFQEAIGNFEEAIRLEQPGLAVGVARSALFLGKAYAGEREDAARQLAGIALPRRAEVNSWGKWWSLPSVVEGLAVLGDAKRAAELYPLVVEAMGLGSVVGFTFYLAQKVAGIAAAAGGQWEKAEQRYQTALRQAHDIPHRLEQPEVRRWYARMLVERNLPGDRERARELLQEASEAYSKIGMPKHLEMAQQMLSNL